MDLSAGEFNLINLSARNVILGKNGCGKSYILKQFESVLRRQQGMGKVRYISPERGGLLQYEPNVEQSIISNPTWMGDVRRRNQSDNFRQQSAVLFRRLEMQVLREIEREHTREGYVPRTFDDTINQLNLLLDRVRIERDNLKAFKIVNRDTNTEAQPDAISSGEAELVSLGIEFLAFVKECEAGLINILLVDEPDVHLHPDLQDRLARFIIATLKDSPVTLILATHSTALLAALSEGEETRVAFMRRNDTRLDFKLLGEVDKTILPIFGAHPLSNVFNQAPVFLVEGEDDERVWQQAIRSSAGKIRIYPCVVDSITRFAAFESEVNNIIEAVYDNAVAYSLRDRDLHPESIEDVGHVIRMRLSCRAAENLFLTNEALQLSGTDWTALKARISEWATCNANHQYRAEVQGFIDGGFDRKGYDLKNIRNILVGLLTNKPWEVLAGLAIANLAKNGGQVEEGSVRDYLGEKLCRQIIDVQAPEQVRA